MTVPDRICGLEVRHRNLVELPVVTHYVESRVATWRIDVYRNLGSAQALLYIEGAECGTEVYHGFDEAALIAAVEASIRSVAEECRAFADKVLGEP